MLILGSSSSSASYGFMISVIQFETSALKFAGATGNASPTASSFVASSSKSCSSSRKVSLKISKGLLVKCLCLELLHGVRLLGLVIRGLLMQGLLVHDLLF